jgi:hypothetical protein
VIGDDNIEYSFTENDELCDLSKINDITNSITMTVRCVCKIRPLLMKNICSLLIKTVDTITWGFKVNKKNDATM